MSNLPPKPSNENDAFDLLDWGVRTVKAVPGTSPGRGRGLFAASTISKGEIIDRACSVFISSEQADELNTMLPLGNFYFRHPRSSDHGLMVLGLPSLCNHADMPNADVRFIDCGGCGWVSELYALEDIPTRAEITYRYKCPLWFDQV